MGNWLLEGSDNWIYCGGENRVYNTSLPPVGESDVPSAGTFAFYLDTIGDDLIELNNNLTLFLEEAGLDYPELLLGESKILKVLQSVLILLQLNLKLFWL